jgi:hypothetical protein
MPDYKTYINGKIYSTDSVHRPDTVIEYAIVTNNEGSRPKTNWINLTTEGVWVARNHLRPTDVRLTTLEGYEEFDENTPPTSAELLTLILLGTPYDPKND